MSQVANALIMRKVHEALGIDRCEVCVSAAAPISRSTIDFFHSLGVSLVEVYGMTEATGQRVLHTHNSRPNIYRLHLYSELIGAQFVLF